MRGLARRVAPFGASVRGVIESMNGARFVHDTLEEPPDPWRRTVDAGLALFDDIDRQVAQLMRAELALGAMPVIPGGNTNVPTMTSPNAADVIRGRVTAALATS